VFLLVFIVLFINTRYGAATGYQHLFFRFDPLILIITSIASRTIIQASMISIIVIIGTFIFGRFFCGFICPLGTTIDLWDGIFKNKHISKHNAKNVKYIILLALIIAACIGSSFIHFFDPLIIMERTLTIVVSPIATFFRGILLPVTPLVYTETIVATLLFFGILSLGFIAPRYWCRAICPLGGLLALFSKYSLLKFSLSDSCTQCGVCDRICPTSAISSEDQELDSSECIACLKCQHECAHHAVVYRINGRIHRFDLSKRHLLLAIGAGIATVPLSRSLLHSRISGRLIRPPGSVPEPDFLNLCLHCGKCMKVCPTNGLQPCVLETGVNGIWTPRLVPRIGGCEKNCNMCGQICPTGAIRALPLEEKTFAKMGTAVIARNRCIAWEQDNLCLICDEACPYDAIMSRNVTVQQVTLLRPFIDERICTGCGLCEARCPVEGASAIQIYSIGEERKHTGSYITEEKRRLRSCIHKQEDIPSGFITE
jgi:polyferredoxin